VVRKHRRAESLKNDQLIAELRVKHYEAKVEESKARLEKIKEKIQKSGDNMKAFTIAHR
jgi:chaperonin cofactor prefoldin